VTELKEKDDAISKAKIADAKNAANRAKCEAAELKLLYVEAEQKRSKKEWTAQCKKKEEELELAKKRAEEEAVQHKSELQRKEEEHKEAQMQAKEEAARKQANAEAKYNKTIEQLKLNNTNEGGGLLQYHEHEADMKRIKEEFQKNSKRQKKLMRSKKK
jgi:hypothetical protein